MCLVFIVMCNILCCYDDIVAAAADTTKATKGKDKKGGKGQTKGNAVNEPEVGYVYPSMY